MRSGHIHILSLGQVGLLISIPSIFDTDRPRLLVTRLQTQFSFKGIEIKSPTFYRIHIVMLGKPSNVYLCF